MIKIYRKWKKEREERKFVEEIFGKHLNDVQRFNKVLNIIKEQSPSAISYTDLYQEVYKTDNGVAPNGQILDKELHDTLLILKDKQLIEQKEPTANYYFITGKGLEYNIKSLEYSLLDNQIISNRVSIVTNVYIAAFTFIAAEYYGCEFLRNYITDSNSHKQLIVNSFLLFVLLGSLSGIIFMILLFRKSRN